MADQQLDAEVVLSAKDEVAPVVDKAADALEAASKDAGKFERAASRAGSIASKAFGKAQGAVNKLERGLVGLAKNSFVQAAGAAGIGLGMAALTHKVVEGRIEMEELTDTITGVHVAFKSWNEDLDITERIAIAGKEAKDVWSDLDELSARLAVNARGLGFAYSNLSGPVLGTLGKSQEEMLGFVTKTAEAAKTFGADMGQLGKTVAKALSLGVIEGEDPLSLHLRSALGNMSKLTEAQRFAKIDKELSGFAETADNLATSFVDVSFRIKKFFGDFIRDAGGPTLTYILEKIDGWRQKLEATNKAGEKLSDVWGKKILKFFKKAEDVVSTLLKYWKEIAVVIGGVKLAGLAGSAAAGAGGMLAAFTGPLGKVGEKLTGFAGKLSGSVAALGIFYAALSAGAKLLDDWQGKNLKAQDKAQRAEQVLLAANEKTAFKMAQSMGLIERATGKVTASAGNLQRGFDEMEEENVRKLLGKKFGLGGASEQVAGERTIRYLEQLSEKFFEKPKVPGEGTLATDSGVHPKGVRKAVVNQTFGNVYIQQDFKQGDPARVFVRLKNDIEGLAEKRLSSNLSETFGD